MSEEARDVRLAVLEERIGNVIKNQETYSQEAQEWRSRFCKKLDLLIERDNQRPCSIHEHKLKSIGVLWNIVYCTVAGVLGLAVIWGGLIVTVESHTKAIDRITEAHNHSREGQAKI